MCWGVSPASMSAHHCKYVCMPGPCKDQKDESHPPELEFLMVVSCCLGPGNQT